MHLYHLEHASVSLYRGDDDTCVSIALVWVEGQEAQVSAWGLIWRSGDDQVHYTFGLPNGGHRLRVGHTRHQVIVYLHVVTFWNKQVKMASRWEWMLKEMMTDQQVNTALIHKQTNTANLLYWHLGDTSLSFFFQCTYKHLTCNRGVLTLSMPISKFQVLSKYFNVTSCTSWFMYTYILPNWYIRETRQATWTHGRTKKKKHSLRQTIF